MQQDRTEIKRYLEKAYKLEKDIYVLREAGTKLVESADKLCVPKKIEEPRLYATKEYEGDRTGGNMGAAFWNMISSKVFWIMLVIGSSILANIGYEIFRKFYEINEINTMRMFLGSAALFVIGWLAVGTAMYNSVDKSTNEKIARENEEIERKNKEEQKKYELALNNEQKRMEREAEKATAILKKKEEIDNLRNSCESNLKNLYSRKVGDSYFLYPKYQNLTAVGMLFEYFDADRCDTLREAYNLVEEEIDRKHIIGSLDTIANMQVMLYGVMDEMNEKIDLICNEILKA